MPNLRIIAADSAAAVLDEKFVPILHIASAAVLVEPPYREANIRFAEPIFKEVNNGYDIIVHEIELCQFLLETVQADVVHLDSTLGSVSVEELSAVELSNMKVGAKARGNLLKVLPRLRRIAGEIRRKHNIEVLAIGKESMAVRIAELTAGSEAIIFASAKVIKDQEPLILGLPTRCQHSTGDNKIYLHSLIEAEHDVRGYAQDKENVLAKVNIIEMQNPIARGFRILKISPKQ